MKKILLLISLLSFLSGTLTAQNPVPNPGFESWTFSSNTITDEPDNWESNNLMDYHAVFKSLIAHSGAYSARGEVSLQGPSSVAYAPLLTSIGNGFAVSQFYGSLKFWYRFNSVSGDIMLASAIVYDGSATPIGGGSLVLNPAAAWTMATVPVSYTGSGPSTCKINFAITDQGGGSNFNVGSYFLVDDVQMTDIIGIGEIAANAFSVIQNPATESILVYRNSSSLPVTLELLDGLGRKVSEQQIAAGEHEATVNVNYFSPGIYFIKVLNEKNSFTQKIVVQR